MINKKTGSKTDKKRIVSFDLDMTLLDQATWKIPDSAIEAVEMPVFRRSTRKFPSFSSCHFFISFPASRFFLYLQQIFNALLGLFLLKKFF